LALGTRGANNRRAMPRRADEPSHETTRRRPPHPATVAPQSRAPHSARALQPKALQPARGRRLKSYRFAEVNERATAVYAIDFGNLLVKLTQGK